MPNLFIATNEEQIRFGNKEYVFSQQGITRYCIEQVSDELFDSLVYVAGMNGAKTTIAYLLYNILDKKSLSNN